MQPQQIYLLIDYNGPSSPAELFCLSDAYLKLAEVGAGRYYASKHFYMKQESATKMSTSTLSGVGTWAVVRCQPSSAGVLEPQG